VRHTAPFLYQLTLVSDNVIPWDRTYNSNSFHK
jgi:hypothetical protein